MSNINKTIYDAIKPHVENDKLTKEDAYKTIINTQKKTIERVFQMQSKHGIISCIIEHVNMLMKLKRVAYDYNGKIRVTM